MILGRDYVQPQWIFDCINRRQLLPVHKYFLGEMLPPHLSPFIKEERRIGDYVPPEEKDLLEPKEQNDEEERNKSNDSDAEHEDEDESPSEEESSNPTGSEGEELEEDQNMKVNEGKPNNSNKSEEEKLMEDEQYRLRVMMVKRKHRGLYRSMMKARKKRVHESKQLERKRKMHDANEGMNKSTSEGTSSVKKTKTAKLKK